MEKIASRNNERIKAAAGLIRSASERAEKGLFVIEGARLCRDAYLSGIEPAEIYVTAAALKKYSKDLPFIEAHEAHVFEISEEVSEKLSDTKNPQGIFCICKTLDKKYNIDKMKYGGFYAALDNIQTPDNLGAVLRTAEAMGLDGAVISGGCDIYNPKALRASMGAAFRLPLIRAEYLPLFLERLSLKGMKIFACVPDEKALTVSEADFSGGAAAVIGNEGAGISEEVLAACGERITIPMRGKAESLNAAAAAAIVFWEISKGMN